MYIDWMNEDYESPQPHAARGSTNGYGLAFDYDSADSIIDATNQNIAWLRDDAIRHEGYNREDTYWQRQFADMEKAGINPAVLLSSISGSNYSGVSSASAFKSSSVDDYRHKKVQEAQNAVANNAKVLGALASIVGAIAMVAHFL